MRDVALVAAIFVSLPVILRYPFAGVLVWSWISIAAPHQETWGFATLIPLNFIVAAVTIFAFFVSKERRPPPPGVIYWVFVVFLLWVTFNSFFAFKPEWSWQYWDRCWKTIVLGLFAAAMSNNKIRLHALVWIIVISLFYYGIRGGVFTLITGGQYRVYGPPNSYIADNNCLALALLMALPLANYLRLQTRSRPLSIGVVAAMVLSVIAVVGSYSRGAILGLGALLLAGVFRTRHRFVYLAVGTIMVALLFNFMPESFHDRVQTISEVGSDESFQGRVSAWWVAFYCARDHFPVGVGFYGPQLHPIFNHYMPDVVAHAAHSIYFQVLGEHGFVGLFIYLLLIAAAFISAARIRNWSCDIPELRWAFELSSMIQLSLVAFCVGGAALSMAYYDVFVLEVAILLPLAEIVRLTASNAVPAKQRFAFGSANQAPTLALRGTCHDR